MGDAQINDVYYDAENPGGYGGVARLRHAANTNKVKTDEFLKRQRTYTLRKPARLRYSTRPYKVAGIDQQWQADLVEMIPYEEVNDGYRYMLTVIDLFNRYAWTVPIKNKTGKEIMRVFREIFATGASVIACKLMKGSSPIGMCSTYLMWKIFASLLS